MKMQEIKTFSYSNQKYNVNVSTTLPFYESVEELTYILIDKHNLPVFLDKDLKEKLCEFISEYNINHYNEKISNSIQYARVHISQLEEVTKEWDKIIKEEMAEYGEQRCASDEELFANAYHKLVHSPALKTMLQLEHVYSQTVRQRTDEKCKQINILSERQTEEMNNAVDRLEKDITEFEINEMAARHFEDQTLLQVQMTSEIDTIKEAQRREYREWLMQMLEQKQTDSSLPSPRNSSLTPVAFDVTKTTQNINRTVSMSDVPLLEESFTIHLGSQLKQMHNIRVMIADVMDLCTVEDSWQLSEPTPQLLQTALALYSNDLCGLVLMADNVIGSRFTKDFTDICQRSTEFHFSHIEDQLDKISNTIESHLKSSAKTLNIKYLQAGDFYVTRHSNLAQVHIIFHMVTNDGLKASDINSRHAVVLGLRNILKTACSNDITSLTIPLLLQYEMTEEMTVTWCAKRAELVFKCVKGFMIEMASWGGSDLKNLQFLLPRGISTSVFQSLTTMLPSIFKVSNPLVLKSSTYHK